MYHLVVDSKFATTIIDDQHTHTSAAIGKGIVQPRPKSTLINDWQPLLNVTRLSHSNNTAIITDVKDTVLLENWAEHVLDNDRWGRIRDKARLLVELFGEEVYAKVAVLASLSRGGDANDLARSALKDQQVANANVVARDGYCIPHSATTFDIADSLMRPVTDASRSSLTIFPLDDDLLSLMVRSKGVENAIRRLLQTVAEGVIVTFVVVVTHT